MKRRELITLVALSIVLVIAVHIYSLLFIPASTDKSSRIVEIPQGVSFRVVTNILIKNGIIRDARGMDLLAWLTGSYRSVKAGEYELSPSMSAYQVLDVLVKGRVKEYVVTFPEGYSIKEIARTLARRGLVDEEEFIKKAMSREFARSLGLPGPTLEGYLFPDTYRFTKNMGVEGIIRKMTERFKTIYDGELKELARKRGMTMKEVVTLASIIEKEAGSRAEMRDISAVFHNRLKKGYRLESDPTVIYGIPDFDGNLTRKHLRTWTPYNTYLIYGLPPGPIASPGRDALRAALDPSPSDYLYFVSKNDGTHHFSRTLREHNMAVERYQKGLVKRR